MRAFILSTVALTALALAAKGYRVTILERAAVLQEIGAGLQLSPNATRVLIDLGLKPRFETRVTAPDAISVMSGRNGRELARIPLGDAAAFRYGAPYWVLHRADLQAALREAVDENPDIELRLHTTFEDVASHAKGLTIVHRSGTEVYGQARRAAGSEGAPTDGEAPAGAANWLSEETSASKVPAAIKVVLYIAALGGLVFGALKFIHRG